MSSTVSSFDKVFHHYLLDELIDALIRNEFVRTRVTNVKEKPIEFNDLRKGVWLASILAGSTKEEHVRKAQLFAALVYLNYSNNVDLTRAVYVLLSRTGNLTATRFLSGLFESEDSGIHELKHSFGTSLDVELLYNKEENTIDVGEEQYLITRFQKHLWSELGSKLNISISAPTSSGKSFIIKKYLKKSFLEKENFKALYIVPSRALINQVSEELRLDLDTKEVDVRTAFIESPDDGQHDKQIFIMTPERCLRLIQYSWKTSFRLDFIFVDEIQNVEEEGGRGTLLEYVLRELYLLNNKAQIVSAGPNIDASRALFYRLFGVENRQVQTSVSPVFQIRTILRVTDDSIKIILKTLSGKEHLINSSCVMLHGL